MSCEDKNVLEDSISYKVFIISTVVFNLCSKPKSYLYFTSKHFVGPGHFVK